MILKYIGKTVQEEYKGKNMKSEDDNIYVNIYPDISFFKYKSMVVTKGIEGVKVVGALTLSLEDSDMEEDMDIVKRYSQLVYGIRKGYWENGIQLVGIYKQEDTTYFLPAYISVLEELGVDPDEFSGYLAEYIDYIPTNINELLENESKLYISIRENIEEYMSY